MTANAGYHLFNTGDVLTAAQVQYNLQNQTIMYFASSAARTSALSGVVVEGMFSYLADTNSTEYYDGAAWQSISNPGDITGVTAGTGISGGGTSGTVTVTNSMATEITAAGDIIVGTGSGTFDNLPIGTTAQVLTADTTVSPYKVKWATPAGGGGLTLLGTSIPSAATSVSFTGIAATYKHLLVTWSSINVGSGTANWNFRFNADSSSIYNSFYQATGTFTQDQNLSSICPTLSVFGTDPQGSGVANSMYGYLWIYNYYDTAVNKPFSGAGSYYSGAGWKQVASLTGSWNSTAAITSVDLTRISGAGTITATTNGFIKLWGMA